MFAMNRVIWLGVCAALVAGASDACAVPAERMYWTGFYSLIQHASTEGLGRRFYPGITTQFSTPEDLLIDSANDRIYWSDQSNDALWRGNLDGSGVEIIYQGTSIDEPYGISRDPLRSKIYWVAQRSEDVLRADDDGSNVEIVFDGSSANDLRRIAVDPYREKLYWTDHRANAIYWANTDGTMMAPVIPLGDDANDIALDLINEKLYWTTSGFNRISRANLDGTAVETIFTSLDFGDDKPMAIAVDPVAEKIYWNEINAGTIRHSNLDGTLEETLVTAGTSLVRSIALDQELPLMLAQNTVPEPTALSMFALGICILACRPTD